MIKNPLASRRANTDVQEKRSLTLWQIFVGYWLTRWMQIKKVAAANHLQQPHEIFMRILFHQEYIWSLHRQNPHPQMMVFVPARDAHLLLAIPALPFFSWSIWRFTPASVSGKTTTNCSPFRSETQYLLCSFHDFFSQVPRLQSQYDTTTQSPDIACRCQTECQ